jgi:hypothetical protein
MQYRYIEDIDEDIDSYLDLYNNPGSNPPGGSVGEYRALIEYKIKQLLKQKLDKIQDSSEDFQKYQNLKHELKKGRKVEMEHTKNKLEAEKIALDHLKEDPNYYTKLEKIHEDQAVSHNSFNFNGIYNLASLLEREELGLVEPIKIEGIDAKMSALIDSGNGAYNVLHGVDIEDNGNEVRFTTVDGVKVVKDKIDEITIHVGAGYDEHRPVVEFTIEIGSKVYPDVRFSIGDRTENQHPVLVGADFLSQIDALIDVNKTKSNKLT